jgi:hypothetical protein
VPTSAETVIGWAARVAAVSVIPHGYCQCGCGERTPIATKTRTSEGGAVKGQPKRFIHGHHRRKPRIEHIEEHGGSAGDDLLKKLIEADIQRTTRDSRMVSPGWSEGREG